MSFIRTYMEYVKRDEAHENYHLWSCLVVLASLMGRKVWLQRPYQRIYANLYVILVGPQGNRKTAAKDIAQTFMRDVGGITFATEATTRESLIDQMKKTEESFSYNGVTDTFVALTICATEFKEFVGKDPIGIITFMTDVYDRDVYDYGTMKRGTDLLINPYLNMIACETPEWLTDRLKERVVSGGFSRRVTYQYETTHYTYIDEVLHPDCVKAREFCLKDAIRIKNIVGEYKLSPSARDFYNKWYVTKKPPEDPSMIGFHESKHTMLTKIAMLVSASEGSSLTIEVNHFEAALGIIATAETNMNRVFAGGGRNELGMVSMKVLDLLEREKKPVSEKQIQVMLFHDCRDFREMESIITHLMRTDKVIRFTYPGKVAVYLCSRLYLPASVQQALERAAATSSGSVSGGSPQSAPSASHEDEFDLIRELQRTAPSASGAPKAPSQKADPVEQKDTSPQWPPLTELPPENPP